MIKIEKADCHGCHACKNVCPVDAISMESDNEGFWYPKVNNDTCIECGLCIKCCSSLTPIDVVTERKAYAAYNKNFEVRLQSSSGGIFTLLAEQVIEKNGVVFGAVFDENNRVKHISVSTSKDLEKLRGSKYVQSEIGNTYKECKMYLTQGQSVLFSGTPCQIAGLKSFLQKEYENLLTIDIICHGVPSPKIWDIYLKSLGNTGSISSISFRDKIKGWKLFSFSYKRKGKYVSEALDENIFMKAFLKDLCLRPSCYSCKLKTLNRLSDFTIADFWGIQNVIPNLDDDFGISLIITHNEKAESVITSLKKNIICEEVDVEDGVRYNPAAIKSVSKNPKREKFMESVNELNFVEVTLSLTKVRFSKKLYYKLISELALLKRAILK